MQSAGSKQRGIGLVMSTKFSFMYCTMIFPKCNQIFIINREAFEYDHVQKH